MKTNKTVTYAMACLKELGKQWGGFLRVEEIARNQNLPPAYCQKVLMTLARAGLLESQKGRGFLLVRPIAEIAALDVIEAFNADSSENNNAGEIYSAQAISDTLTAHLNRALSQLSVAEVVNA